jgi:hypothetical protein
MNTLAQGTRWELKGDSIQPSILLLTMVDQGKSFPAFNPLTGQAIAESLVAVLDGKLREPIRSNGDIFRVARHELGKHGSKWKMAAMRFAGKHPCFLKRPPTCRSEC